MGGWEAPYGIQLYIGAFGSLVLAYVNRTLSYEVLKAVIQRTAMTTAMISVRPRRTMAVVRMMSISRFNP